jgi:glycosyltransferase involved in cell wall biosynthesis
VFREFRRSFPELPLVFCNIAADVVALGIVQSYAHPGGILTGNVLNAVGGEETMTQKRIGFFKELVPKLVRLGMIAPANGVLAMQEKDALQKLSAQIAPQLQLEAPGVLEPKRVREEMQRSTALLFPSRYEEWGYVAVESLLGGTPVVTYPVYPFAEMLSGGNFGKMLVQVGERLGIGESAAARWLQHFDIPARKGGPVRDAAPV